MSRQAAWAGRDLPVLDATAAGTGAAAVVPAAAAAGAAVGAEPDDPLELIGVPVPVDEETFDEMARCLVEEYVRDGWTDERLLAMFRSPFYAGLHVVLARRGEPWVRTLIDETRVRWHRPDPATRGGA